MTFQPTSIRAAVAAIRDGRLAPLELLERCLAQIGKHEDRLRAWVEIDESGARKAAEALGEEAARGELRGPLHGIPLGIKDIIDVADMPTRAGSPLREDHRAAADAPLVAALRGAGAIILGKTVTVEFACFDPSPSRNPWNTRHTPGGSSSGSAVAVAAGMCMGAIGTQTGGSLVRPSTYCGVAACKPTFGTISLDGVVPVSYHFDHAGPIAQSVADLEVVLRCSMTEEESARLFPDTQDDPETAAPRLGLLRQFFIEEAAEPVVALTEATVEQLRAAGATIKPISFAGGFQQVRPMHRMIMAVEAAAYHRRSFAANRAAYGPMIGELLDEGLKIAAVDYAAALAAQRVYRHRVATLLRKVDALIMPSTDTTAPATLGTTGTPKFQAPWSAAGLPVVSIPCGTADDGMPAAVQLVGRAREEAALLRVAAWCERRIGFRQWLADSG